MGSRGSVLPVFMNQNKNIFPITHPQMTRFNYFKESVDTVAWVFNHMLGSEIFVPKIKSFYITDLARAINDRCKFKYRN